MCRSPSTPPAALALAEAGALLFRITTSPGLKRQDSAKEGLPGTFPFMRRSLLPVLLWAIAWSALARAAPSQDSVSYDIEATLDAKAGTISARALITIPPRSMASPTEVVLDVSPGGRDAQGAERLSLLNVRGGSLAPDRRNGSLAVVAVPRGGDVAHIEVSWRFSLNKEDLDLMGYHCLSANDPESLWYPEIVDASGAHQRFHEFKVKLAYPETMAALTSGTLESSAVSNGTRRDTYVASHAEGFALNLGDGFVLSDVKSPAVRVLAFSSKAEQQTFRRAAEMAAATADWYRKTYGFFPARQIGVAPGHPKYKGGFPTTNLFYIHGGDRTPGFLKGIIAHELGHYYWGLYVQSASWERLDWLMLANGIWADQLFQAEGARRTLDDQWRGNEWMVRFVAAGLAGREQRLVISADEEKALGFDYNSSVRHAKGAVGVWLQARRVGAERFIEFQKTLLAQYRDRPLSVEEFANRLDKAGASGAQEFFRAFARADATFGYEVSNVEGGGGGQDWSYRLTVSRRGTLRYPTAVEVRDQDGKVVRREIAGADLQEIFTVKLQAPLAEVKLDPDGVLPMWNGSHVGIRRAYASALDRAGLTAAFFAWGKNLLAAEPEEDELRIRLAERMLQAGGCQAAADLLLQRAQLPCRSAPACRIVLLLSSSRTRCGKVVEGNEMLGAIKAACVQVGLTKEWERAREEAVRQSALK